MELGFRDRESAFRAHICNPFTRIIWAKKGLEITPVLCTRHLDDLCWLSLPRSPLCVRSCQLDFSTLKKRRNVDLSVLLSSAGKHPKAVSSQGLKLNLKSAFVDITVRTRDPYPVSLNKIRAAFVCAINYYDWLPNAHSYSLAWSVLEPVCLKHRVSTEQSMNGPRTTFHSGFKLRKNTHVASKIA